MFKTNEKGINLIALVITIVVLLILAAITITIVRYTNLTEQSDTTKVKSLNANCSEEINLAIMGKNYKK